MDLLQGSMLPTKVAKYGTFIVLEGPDNSGKSTLISRLVDELCKWKFKIIPFPDRATETGKQLDEFLRNGGLMDLPDETKAKKLHKLFSENRHEKKEYIENLLLSGQNIIVDRYVYSGAAYSHALGLDLEYCFSFDRGLPAPDAVLNLKIDVETIFNRKGFGLETYEQKSMQENVINSYVEVYKKLIASNELQTIPRNKVDSISMHYLKEFKCPYLFNIDARNSQDTVFTEAKEVVLRFLKVRSVANLSRPQNFFLNN